MKKLMIFLTAILLSVTVAGATEFYNKQANDWQVIGVVGNDNPNDLKNTTCYMLLARETTKLLIGYDLVNDELFLLMKDSTWQLDPSADLPNSLGYIEFVGPNVLGEVEMNIVAADRISVRRIDPAGFLPALINSNKMIVYNDFVPKTTIDLTGVEAAVILMNECVPKGRTVTPDIQV